MHTLQKLMLQLTSLFFFPVTVLASCLPSNVSKSDLEKLKENQWAMPNATAIQELAIGLLPCLKDTDPQLRDDLSFEALSFWMRGEKLSAPTLQIIRARLLEQLKTPSKKDITDGFAQPFAALTLAEVVRVDRKKPFLTAIERNEIVDVAANYLQTINDYRGFDEKSGWRHGIAHAADVMLQLSINPHISKVQHEKILLALASQIATPLNAYQYGESQRLAIPIFYLALLADMNENEWEHWFDKLLETTTTTPTQALARKHNLSAFLLILFFTIQDSKKIDLQKKILPIITKSIKTLH